MYGFKTITNEDNKRTFNHIYFRNGKKDMLHMIQRKKNHSIKNKPIEKSQIEFEVIQMKRHNDNRIQVIMKAHDLIENKFNVLVDIRNDLLKEKNERKIYDKYLQIIIIKLIDLMIDNYYNKKTNDNISLIKSETSEKYLFEALKLIDDNLMNNMNDQTNHQSVIPIHNSINSISNQLPRSNNNQSLQLNTVDFYDEYYPLSDCFLNSFERNPDSSVNLSIVHSDNDMNYQIPDNQ